MTEKGAEEQVLAMERLRDNDSKHYLIGKRFNIYSP